MQKTENWRTNDEFILTVEKVSIERNGVDIASGDTFDTRMKILIYILRIEKSGCQQNEMKWRKISETIQIDCIGYVIHTESDLLRNGTINLYGKFKCKWISGLDKLIQFNDEFFFHR